MRILHALTTANPGGTEVSVARLLPALRAQGVEGEVSVLRGPGPMDEWFDALAIPVHALRTGRWPAAQGLRAALKAGQFDILHLYGFEMSVIGRLVARSVSRRPRVVHGIRGLHLTDDQNVFGVRARIAMRLERALGGLVDHYIANSDGAVEFLSARGLPRRKFTVIRNGIDLTQWRPAALPDACREGVVCVANCRRVKRIDFLLEAIALLRRRGLAVPCTIIGDGPEREYLASEARRLGIADTVQFRGRVPSRTVAELLGRSAVLALPSLWEGMPVSVMEAMASALPVVACDVPGVREVVVHEVTGILVDAARADSMADALSSLLECPARARRLGWAGLEHVRREYTLDLQAKQHADTYRRLLSAAIEN